MSYVKNLSVAISPADETAITNALNTAQSTINAVAIVALTPQQRQEIPAVNEARFIYVTKAVSVLGPAYPDLVSRAISTANATQAYQSWTFLRGIASQLEEILDRVRDLSHNLENTDFNYMLDLYYTAKRYKDQLPGSDIVVQELAPLFEGQGDTGITPPTP